MKIKKATCGDCRNYEHFQFHSQFSNLVMEHGAEILNIKGQYEGAYLPCLQKEDQCLKLIIKSPFTKNLQEMDEKRDCIVRGLTFVIKDHLFHPDPEVVKAAQRLQILTNAYGKIHNEPYDGETAAIHNLVKDLTGSYETDASMLNLGDWIAGLDSCNQQFEGLIKERDYESMARTDLRMETVRKELDLIYYGIIEDINARIRIEGATVYATFVEEHNIQIEHYKMIIAQRQGRAAARRENEENEPEEPITEE